ncbi:O-antigen ligase family protein [Bradyrhizobium betae]|uniref:O-antigen ligase-related domain-containing protein n=1 Tax=Bradyrhizobium betae TaxID=244734 RepID=A0A4Q1V7X8_9BRAD|nr:O-antigen ligase family protein [Bradyrhizobium betae]RXT47708.1 hypothetical protein B5V03_15665 [Bradyrhizobium betae]
MAPKRVERGQAVKNPHRKRRGVVRLIAAQAAFACVAAVICLSPFPLGSTAVSFVAAWSLLLGLAAICSVPARLSVKSMVFLLAAFVSLGAYLVVIHEQISVRPWFSSGLVHPIWARAGAVLGEDFPPIVSVVRDVPLIAIGAELAFVLMLLVSFSIASDRRDGLRLLRVVAFAGAAYALLGIVTFAVDPGKILFWKNKTDHLANLTGTFTNRNTAAVFFGQASVLWFLFWCEELRDMRERRGLNLRGAFQRLVAHPTNRSLFALAIFVTTLCAVFMTGSRAGSVLTLIVLLVAFLAYFRREFAHWKAMVAVGAIGSLVATGLMLTVGGNVGQRFSIQGFSDEGRWPVYRTTMQIARDFPELGTGLGSFVAIFQAYRPGDVSISGTWNRAHDVLLELASETGVFVAGGVLAWYLAILFLLIWAVMRRPTRDPLPISAALAAWLMAGLHSLVDFSLQIPGYAFMVAAIVGTGLAQALAPPSASSPVRLSAASPEFGDGVDERSR